MKKTLATSTIEWLLSATMNTLGCILPRDSQSSRMPAPRAVLVKGPKMDAGDFEHALSPAFGLSMLRFCSAGILEDEESLQNIDLLVLPGVSSEHSPYPAIFNARAARAFIRAVENGMAVWASCAAAYHMCEHVLYHTSKGEEIRQQGLGLIAGTAVGPADGPALEPRGRGNYEDTRAVSAVFYDRTGKTRRGKIAYSNGPALIPADSRYADYAFAWYARERAHANGNGEIAMAAVPYGNGMILFSGLLPEISPARIILNGPGHDTSRHAALQSSLRAYETERRALMESLASRCHTHWQKAPKALALSA